jgi:hypothetical protein
MATSDEIKSLKSALFGCERDEKMMAKAAKAAREFFKKHWYYDLNIIETLSRQD